jgi:glycosyltransferase involved in cell wall biosynthesis
MSVPFFVHDPSEASSKCPHYVAPWFEVCHRVTGLSTHGLRQQESARGYYRLERPIGVVHPACLEPAKTLEPRLPEKTIHFGLFGRVRSEKGTLFAIGAFRQLLQLGAQARLTIYGSGPMEPDARELVSSLGLNDHIRFHGPYQPEEFDSLVATVDVGLMPSIYEGFGIVMLELMARGRPVIATDVGSSQEVIGRWGAGIVVERADTGALAAAMHEYCRNPERIVADGAVARRVWEENYTVDAMAERYLSFWRSCGAEV